MKRLTELFWDLPGLPSGLSIPDLPIHFVTADSRQVRPGSLFVAWRGHKTDGHEFIPEALQRGAVALLTEKPVEVPPGIFHAQSSQIRLAYAHLCRKWFDYPDKRLTLVGVTGTNGKSSTAYYLHQLWKSLGYSAGLIGTVFCLADGEEWPATLTTPDSFELYRLLHLFAEKGISHVAMEVSSIALDQERTAGILFRGGIFTNLSHDHLDYHGTFLAYRDAKKRLFDGLSSNSFALTNIDDRHGTFMLQNTAARRYGYSLQQVADFYLRLRESGLWGLRYTLGLHIGEAPRRARSQVLSREISDLHAALLGRFQGYNLLAAVGGAFLTEGELSEKEAQDLWHNLAEASTRLTTLPGRLEPFPLSQERVGLVDYAHTPDAVEKVLRSLRDLLPPGGKLIAVLGAGGDRDRTKRGPMAQAAVQWADLTILTSDNPRSEDPQAILAEMYEAIPKEQRGRVLRLPDRAEAIRTAVQMAPSHSLVAVLGKGHESYQEIAGVKYPFSDREVLLSCREVPYAG